MLKFYDFVCKNYVIFRYDIIIISIYICGKDNYMLVFLCLLLVFFLMNCYKFEFFIVNMYILI